jgi:hypothetical protein
LPHDRIDEILIGAALDIAAAVGLDGSTDDEELDTLDELGHRPAIVSAATEVLSVHAHHIPAAEPVEERLLELKRDAFGTVSLDRGTGRIVRDTGGAPAALRWLARALARREARILSTLSGIAACPQLVSSTRTRLERTYLAGRPMHEASFDAGRFFRDALRQLRRLHARGVVHNDLAKEANWICLPGDRAGIIDFQIARRFQRRGATFRLLAREDLRHLLKHKQHYAPDLLTQRQRAILASPAWTARAWRIVVKPPYLFVTRRLLGWKERHSAVERSF